MLTRKMYLILILIVAFTGITGCSSGSAQAIPNETTAISTSPNAMAQGSEAQDAVRLDPWSTGPNKANCYTSQFHAASDCDRLASNLAAIPSTGNGAYGPTLKNCYSREYHAATDCDRLASQARKNLNQRFREADDASWKSWLEYQKRHPTPVTP